MSSSVLPSKKLIWRTHLRTASNIYQLIKDEAEREDRSVAYIVSRIIEEYYGKRKVIEVTQ